MKKKSIIIGLAGVFTLLITAWAQTAEKASPVLTPEIHPPELNAEGPLPSITHAFNNLTVNGGEIRLESVADVQTMLEALQSDPATPIAELPKNRRGDVISSGYWSLQNPNWPPMPGNARQLDVWNIGNGRFILDDREVDYTARLTEVETSLDGTSTLKMAKVQMNAAYSLNSFGESSASSIYSPDGLSVPEVDFGTNLWIADTHITNQFLAAIGSNTLADVQYEVQSQTNLMQADWRSEGFFYGSTLTNWTPFSVAQNQRTNLFLRLRSWADDGSGLPLWWQQQYFGTNGVDAYGDADGDGWNNLQEFQNDTSPLAFNTPAAPRATATLKINNQATVSWQPVAGPVIGYRIEKSDLILWGWGVTSNYFVSADTFALEDDLAEDFNVAISENGPEFSVEYAVYAQYANADSAPGIASVHGFGTIPDINLVTGANGRLHLVCRDLPVDLKSIRVYREEQFYFHDVSVYFADYFYNLMGGAVPPLADGFFEIPVAKITNNLCALPDGQVAAHFQEQFFVQMVLSNGVTTAWSPSPYSHEDHSSLPFMDLRRQMKDNLTFLLRAAPTQRPFNFAVMPYDWTDFNNSTYSQLTELAVSSIYFLPVDYFGEPSFSPYKPVEDNFIYCNFIFDQNFLTANGTLGTGLYPNGALSSMFPPIVVTNMPSYYYDKAALIAGINSNIPTSLLPTSQTRWITVPPLFIAPTFTGGIFRTNQRNFYGLPFVSAKLTRVENNQVVSQTAYPGETNLAVAGWRTFLETAEPDYQLTNYYFARAGFDPQPESFGFAKTNKTKPMFLGVGNSLMVAGYAKFNILNSTSNRPAYLGQYFEKAEKAEGGGNATGVLSPYGNFFATEPGDVAMVTMPDIDNGARGTNIVHCVAVAVDKNHDGTMDLTFSGADATSQTDPMTFWVNNDFDRGHTVDGDDFEQDDLVAAEISKLPAEQRVADGDYTTNGLPAIPCPRDLEDYFRLWTPGLAAAMRAMPTNYTVSLYLWGDAELRVFQAEETDGGTNYLFDSATASNQVAHSASHYLGKLANNEIIALNITTNFNEHFIVCGSHAGDAQVGVFVSDGSSDILYASAFLQIKDIKQMYERWTVGDDPKRSPISTAIPAVNDLPIGSTPFLYPATTDTNTPYILSVHGWNMTPYEKARFAETAYKRLYWQGYQGRFGCFQWPTDYGISSELDAIIHASSFDDSEMRAWKSAAGLLDLLDNLNIQHPDNVYLFAHSQGNIVAGEALKLAGTNQVVNTFIAMQAAIAAHAFDATRPVRVLNATGFDLDSGTPNRYAQYYTNGAPPYFDGASGARTYVNFYNTNDWALTLLWRPNQDLKPYPGHGYDGTHFYQGYLAAFGLHLLFPIDTYEIFSYCDEARCQALGAQAGVGGVFGVGVNFDLRSIWPPDTHPKRDYKDHVWHSAEFRSDNMSQARFWDAVLGGFGFNLK